MRIPRIFTSAELSTDQTVHLDSNASVHVREVLRLKKDYYIILFNGDGFDYSGQITLLTKKQIEIRLNSREPVHNESSLAIHLLQPLCRSEKMDWSIQKATELGVTNITPIICTRSNVKFAQHKIEKKLFHWQAVIQSACEQSGRAKVPHINAPELFSNAINAIQDNQTLRVAAVPNAKQTITTLDGQASKTCICAIGPEGGFSDDELKLLESADFEMTSLGPRILRLETAVISLITLIQSSWGDLN